jgi:hypothetical protein
MEQITQYEKEVMNRTGWTLKFTREVLRNLRENNYGPADRQYYLEMISPF